MNQRSNVLVVVALGLMLGVSGCAHTETLVPEAAAPPGSATGATPAAPHVLFSQLKGRMVSVKMIDRRADTANTSLLLERTQKLAQGVLREGGAQIGDSDDQLIIMVDDFGERDQGSMTSQCAKFTGRFLKKGLEFLPNDVTRERCVIEGQPEQHEGESSDLTRGLMLGARGLPGVQGKAGLARAYGLALSELLTQLDRQAR